MLRCHVYLHWTAGVLHFAEGHRVDHWKIISVQPETPSRLYNLLSVTLAISRAGKDER